MNPLSVTSAPDKDDELRRLFSVPVKDESFDFVLIDADEGVFHVKDERGGIDQEDDDESYDYCDDVVSMFSSTGSHSHGDDNLSDSLVELKESILTVPDVLMKDLDEAHAAAKLVQFDDLAHQGDGDLSPCSPKRSDHYSSASSVVSMEEEDDDEEDRLPKTDPTDSWQGKQVGMDEDMVDASTISPGCANVSSVSSFTQTKEEQNQDVEDPRTVYSGLVGSATQEGTTSISRTSNKKRRKKLRMLKKAQAAASAARKLSEKGNRDTSPSKAHDFHQEQQQQQAKSRASKKAVNVAVACATETLMAYREELILRGIK